jgi:uncharacterized membrane protein
MRGQGQRLAVLVLLLLVLGVGLALGWRATQRHDALQTNAEDLGFTDQVLWNFLHGQVFRFSTYQNAELSTDINLAAVRRPDSLLAFHVEPILVLIAPLYLIVPDVRAILWLQGLAMALGAIPAYSLARRRLGSPLAGLAFAAAYLLAPLGQWAAMADFHSVALAAPLLLLAIDALDAGRPRLFLVAGLLAASTKEEVGLLVAGLGLVALLWRGERWAGLAAIVLGAGWSIVCVTVIIPHYSGGAISPFTARYADLGGSPGAALRTLFEHPAVYLAALSRPEVLAYAATLLLCGVWIGLLAPELLLAAAPVLALNVLSSSPWMAAGRAHYSASVLPLVLAAAIVGTGRLAALAGGLTRRWEQQEWAQQATPLPGWGGGSPSPLVVGVLSVAIVLGAGLAYHRDGIGPLVADLPAPTVLPRDVLGRRLAASIPPDATVSASSALYPHLSQRADAYLFPTLNGADFVLVDVAVSPYPIEPGGIRQRTLDLLASGSYRLLAAEDGFLLLKRESVADPSAQTSLPDQFFSFARAGDDQGAMPIASFQDGAIAMMSARLVPSGEVGPRGPLGTLQTTWRVTRPVPERPRPEVAVQLRDGERQTFGNLAVLWWYPPEVWRPGELIRVDVPELPIRGVVGWTAEAPLDPPDEKDAPTAFR